MKGTEIVQNYNLHSNETVTERKHVTKYKNMRKWLIEILRKFESHGNKIALVTQFASPNTWILILFGVGVRSDVDIFKLTARAQSFVEKSMYQCY